MPAPNVTLKSNWLVQQQPVRSEGVHSTSKEIAKWKSRTGTRDETTDATGVDMGPGNSWRTTSKVDVDLDLKVQEVAQNALGQDEANTQETNRVNMGPNKISIRNYLAKDDMIFSEESSRAIFEMGNVELIESKKTSDTDQFPSCLKYVFEGTIVRECVRPNKSTMVRIREAFEALKAPYCRTAPVISRGNECGPNPWQQDLHKARGALRGATKKGQVYFDMGSVAE